MKAQVEIEAGICGSRTQAMAEIEDRQHVSPASRPDGEKTARAAAALAGRQPLDAAQEINPAGASVLLHAVRAA